jgi:hypothetical protein
LSIYTISFSGGDQALNLQGDGKLADSNRGIIFPRYTSSKTTALSYVTKNAFLVWSHSSSWIWAMGAAYCITEELENSHAGMVASDTTQYLQFFLIWLVNWHPTICTIISNFVTSDSTRVPVLPEYRVRETKTTIIVVSRTALDRPIWKDKDRKYPLRDSAPFLNALNQHPGTPKLMLRSSYSKCRIQKGAVNYRWSTLTATHVWRMQR